MAHRRQCSTSSSRNDTKDSVAGVQAEPGRATLNVISKRSTGILGNLMRQMFASEAVMYEEVLPALEDVARLQEPLPWPRRVQCRAPQAYRSGPRQHNTLRCRRPRADLHYHRLRRQFRNSVQSMAAPLIWQRATGATTRRCRTSRRTSWPWTTSGPPGTRWRTARGSWTRPTATPRWRSSPCCTARGWRSSTCARTTSGSGGGS